MVSNLLFASSNVDICSFVIALTSVFLIAFSLLILSKWSSLSDSRLNFLPDTVWLALIYKMVINEFVKIIIHYEPHWAKEDNFFKFTISLSLACYCIFKPSNSSLSKIKKLQQHLAAKSLHLKHQCSMSTLCS